MTSAVERPASGLGGAGLTVPFAVTATALHLPDEIVTNHQLARTLDTSDAWIVSHTGIRERRRLDPTLATSDMMLAAARPALAAAGLSPGDLDAVIAATYTPDQPLPSTALIVKDRLGCTRALTLDVTQAACTNGLQAVLIAAHLLQNPVFTTVLVIAADCASRVTAPGDRTTRVFFGDAAAAVVLSRDDTPGAGLLSWDLASELSYAVQIPSGGCLSMDGRAVWDVATDRLPRSIAHAARRAGLTVDQIQHYFLHQANLNIVTATMDRLGVPRDRAPVTVDRIGNTGSAGVFTALHEAHSRGRLRPGDTYVLSAIGAGFQWGTLCLRHA